MTEPLLSLAVAEPRRPRGGSLVGLVVTGALAAGVFGVLDRAGEEFDGTLADEAVGAAVGPGPVTGGPPAAGSTVPDGADPARPGPAELGTADGVVLAVPGLDPVVVSYHEASYPEARPIAPAGTVVRNDNPTRSFDHAHADGPAYLVQVSRGRVQGPTSAVDVVLRDGDEVLAPVAGTVSEVRPYLLYGQHEDVRIELRPDDRPDLRVVLIHLEGARVTAGDRVEVGDVLAAGARRFPFEAVVDRATAPDRHGHVHLEVKVSEPDRTAADDEGA